MLTRLWDWLTGNSLGTVPNWNAHRRRLAERETWNYLGVYPELTHEWWARFKRWTQEEQARKAARS